ncbi:MAG: hypothetical protein JWP97_5782, partial [Labilithrix sp.]|nr:hypothetical protein [Labilithrix sp.]
MRRLYHDMAPALARACAALTFLLALLLVIAEPRALAQDHEATAPAAPAASPAASSGGAGAGGGTKPTNSAVAAG